MARESGVDYSTMRDTLKHLETEVNKIHKKTQAGMIKAMLDTIRRAMKLAPVVSGNLRASSFVIWGKNRNPKVAATFVDHPFNGITASEMSAQHDAFIAETRQSIIDVSGLNPTQGAIGFSAVYALNVHENPRAGNTGGTNPRGKIYREGTYSVVGQWKFLETPMKETNRIASIIIAEAEKK